MQSEYSIVATCFKVIIISTFSVYLWHKIRNFQPVTFCRSTIDAVIFFSWPFDKKFATSMSGTFSSFGSRSGLFTPSGLALAIWTAAKKARIVPLKNLVAFWLNSTLFAASFDDELESALKLDLILILLLRPNEAGLKESTATAHITHRPKIALMFGSIFQ